MKSRTSHGILLFSPRTTEPRKPYHARCGSIQCVECNPSLGGPRE